MKKRLWIPIASLAAALALTACLKNDDDIVQCTPNSLQQDQRVIDSFINVSSQSYLSYSTTYSAYYGLSAPGDGAQATGSSEVAFKRTVRLLNGTVLGTDSIYRTNSGNNVRFSDFETTSPLYYLLSNAKLNGTLRLIYPSSTNPLGAWGCEQQTLSNGTVIPAYSQIIFDYTLTGIKN